MDENSKDNLKINNPYDTTDSDERPIVWLRDDNDRKYRELSWKLRKGESQYLLFEGAGSIFEKKLNPNSTQFSINNQGNNTTAIKRPIPTVDIDISNDVPAKNANGQMNVDTNFNHQQPLDEIADTRSPLDRMLDNGLNLNDDVDAFAKEQSNQALDKFDESRQKIDDNLNQNNQSEWQPDTQSVTANQQPTPQPATRVENFKSEATPVDLKRRGQIEALNKKLQSLLKNQSDS